MMRLYTILLLSVIMVQTCSRMAIFVNYEFNKKQITERYCINKFNPMAHCNGMCHVIKQLQKEEKQDKTPLKSQDDRSEFQLFSQTEDESLFNIFPSGEITYSVVPMIKVTSAVSSIFHPPSF